jgi:cobalt-zinc-cadmium efflux system outer membrane protein
MQLRALAVQSRSAYRQAVNNYNSAWKQLAASLGDPNLPSAILEGEGARVGSPIDYEGALAYMLSNHTDILGARNLEFQARLNVRLAEVTPIPDVKVYSAIQHDFTTPPVGRTTYNLQLGVPVPIFNQNRGGIQKARGELVRAAEELNRVRIDLSAQLADTFARYENNRIALEYYRDHILPDLARVYRGVYERHQQASDQQGAQPVGFGDIIVAQQQLMTAITTYVTAMNDQWTAYADLAGLLQLEDLGGLPLAEPPPPAELPAVPDDPADNP